MSDNPASNKGKKGKAEIGEGRGKRRVKKDYESNPEHWPSYLNYWASKCANLLRAVTPII